MCSAKVLREIILDLMKGNKPVSKMDKYKVSVIRRDDKMFITSKIGTICVNRDGIQDNGCINSWNADMIDHISSFKQQVKECTTLSVPETKSRVICFGDVQRESNTYVYPIITIERLDELFNKGYKYFLGTTEEHASDVVLKWIQDHPTTRWILMKNRQETQIPPNCVSYDHRWQIQSILESEFPGKCVTLTNPEDWIPDQRNVVLCNFKSEDQWKKLKYIPGYYYWSINPSTTHHNSLRVHTGSDLTLVDDALWIFDYYDKFHHKPEASPIGKYVVQSGGYRKFTMFEKYVVHEGKELNHYIIHIK